MDHYSQLFLNKLLSAKQDAINDFLGYKSTETDIKALSNEIKDIASQMPEEELQKFYEQYNIYPSERQQNCRFGFCFMGETHSQTYCRFDRENKKEGECYVTNEECNACKNFKSKYIEYPITVNKINSKKFDTYGLHEIGSLVAIRPCAKEYHNQTYLGIYLGDLPYAPSISYNEDSKELSVTGLNNPAIYVFELKKIIFGMQSWWRTISSLEEFKDISDKTINNQPYVQILKRMYPSTSPSKRFSVTETSDAFPDKTDAFAIWDNKYDTYYKASDGTIPTWETKEDAEYALTLMETPAETNLRVIMNIACPTKQVEELQRILDHHMEYLIDFDENKDLITSVSNVCSYDIDTEKQNLQKLQIISILIDDILATEPSILVDDILATEPDDEALENNQSMIDLYAKIHNLKETLNNNL